MKRYGWFAALGTLITILLISGAGYLVYQAGFAQGASSGEAITTLFRPGTFWTGILGFLLVLFLIKFVMRLVFFPFFAFGMGRRFGRWGHHRGHWGWDSDRPIPPFFQEWHARVHANENPPDSDEGAEG